MIYWKANETNECENESSHAIPFSNFPLIFSRCLVGYCHCAAAATVRISTQCNGIKWNANEWEFAEGYVEADAHANGPRSSRRKKLVAKKVAYGIFEWGEENRERRCALLKRQWIIHFIAIFIALWGWYSWIDEVEMSEYLLSPFEIMHTHTRYALVTLTT